MMWLLIFAGVSIIVMLWIRRSLAEKNYIRFKTSEGYPKLQALLRACKTIDKKYPVEEIKFEETSNYSTTWFRCYIRIQGLGTHIGSISRMLCEAENKVEQNYNAEVSKIIIIGPGQIKPALDRANKVRDEIQRKTDNTFYSMLFDNDQTSRAAIRSPFECYSSSGGKYIVDDDLWEISGTTAVYKCLFNFNGLSKAALPALIKKTLKEYFPKSVASHSQTGCQIRN